jgi:hypothetical protein
MLFGQPPCLGLNSLRSRASVSTPTLDSRIVLVEITMAERAERPISFPGVSWTIINLG